MANEANFVNKDSPMYFVINFQMKIDGLSGTDWLQVLSCFTIPCSEISTALADIKKVTTG